MAESDREAEVLARLEAALDRISQRGPIGIPPAPSATPYAAADAVAGRLDALIAQLRGALESGPAALEE